MTQVRDHLFKELMSWMMTHPDVFPDEAVRHKEATKSAAWTSVCAWPSSAPSEYVPPARFLIVFFQLDDAPHDVIGQVLDAVRADSKSRGRRGLDPDAEPQDGAERADLGRDSAAQGPIHAQSTRIYDLYQEISTLECPSNERARERFACSFGRMCEGMLREPKDISTIDEKTLFEIRRDSVAVRPFLDAWLLAKGICLPSDIVIEDTLRRSLDLLITLTTDLVIIANDLGGLEKDRRDLLEAPTKPDLNVVLAQSNNLEGALENKEISKGCEDRIKEYEDKYEDKIKEFWRQEQELKEKIAKENIMKGGEKRVLDDYLRLLKNTIDGNIEGHIRLAEIRYPNAEYYLSGLSRIIKEEGRIGGSKKRG